MIDNIKKWLFGIEKTYPEFWADYLQCSSNGIDSKKSIREFRMVVFDTETTGFDLKNDRIIQVGAIGVKGHDIDLADSFNLFIKQSTSGASEVKSIHGIRDTSLQDAQEENEVVRRFIDYIKDAVLVAHHAAFDVGMINQALLRSFGPGMALKNQFIDTVNLERRLSSVRAYDTQYAIDLSLDKLIEKYRLDPYERHTAIGDAYITAQLLLKLIARMERVGNRSLRDFLR